MSARMYPETQTPPPIFQSYAPGLKSSIGGSKQTMKPGTNLRMLEDTSVIHLIRDKAPEEECEDRFRVVGFSLLPRGASSKTRCTVYVAPPKQKQSFASSSVSSTVPAKKPVIRSYNTSSFIQNFSQSQPQQIQPMQMVPLSQPNVPVASLNAVPQLSPVTSQNAPPPAPSFSLSNQQSSSPSTSAQSYHSTPHDNDPRFYGSFRIRSMNHLPVHYNASNSNASSIKTNLLEESISSSLATVIPNFESTTPEALDLIDYQDDAIVVRVSSAQDTNERLMRGSWRGRARRDEIYGEHVKRELIGENTSIVTDKSGYVPFNTLCKAQKIQSVYLVHELRNAGLFNGAIIHSISLKISDCPDRSLENFRIGLAWSNCEMLTEFLESPTSVVYGPCDLSHSLFLTNEWLTFNLSRRMEWDGKTNLILELSKDESHASFSWPATGGIYFKSTSSIRTVAQKDNNDASGQYPFSSWTKPTRFRKVPCLALEVMSPPCYKIVCHEPLNGLYGQLVYVDVSFDDNQRFTREGASICLQEEDQGALLKLMNDFGTLVNCRQKEKFSDVEFTVGEKTDDKGVFWSHLVVLAARSPLFLRLSEQLHRSSDFELEFMSAKVKKDGTLSVTVPEIRASVFHAVLTFLYKSHAEIQIETSCELLKVADQYELHDLRKSCEVFLKHNAVTDNITALLLSAEKLKVTSIRTFCLDFVLWHFDTVSKTEAFARNIIPKHHLMREILLARKSFLARHNIPAQDVSLHEESSMIGRDQHQAVASFPQTLVEDMKNLLLNTLNDPSSSADVHFVVGEEPEIRDFYAHRAVICSRCEVFKAMFMAEMIESSERSVNIPNISPVVFDCLLHFLYTSQCDIHHDNVFQLFRAADQYGLQDLKETCEQFMIQDISIDNVAFYLVQADVHRISSVREFCVSLSVKEFDEVSVSEAFLSDVIESHDLVLEILSKRIK